MSLDDLSRLGHMLDSAKEALSFIQSKTREDLHNERQLLLALVRCIEVIGEAASKVSPEFQNRHKDLPWKAMVGMRNRLIHGYFDIDADRVWDTVNNELPPLTEKLETILPENS